MAKLLLDSRKVQSNNSRVKSCRTISTSSRSSDRQAVPGMETICGSTCCNSSADLPRAGGSGGVGRLQCWGWKAVLALVQQTIQS
jgi:hypothetical protein